ncbi:hypothetical protein STEG23_025414, partial [Scotinomys teguina]
MRWQECDGEVSLREHQCLRRDLGEHGTGKFYVYGDTLVCREILVNYDCKPDCKCKVILESTELMTHIPQ